MPDFTILLQVRSVQVGAGYDFPAASGERLREEPDGERRVPSKYVACPLSATDRSPLRRFHFPVV